MAKIYKYYALIYLYNKNYDAALNYLMDALQYIKNVKKISLEKKLNNLIAVVSYLKGEYEEALNIIKKSLDIQEGELLHFIFNRKDEEVTRFSERKYQVVAMFYLSNTNKEIHFEYFIRPIINQLPDEIRLVLVYDIYIYYKSA